MVKQRLCSLAVVAALLGYASAAMAQQTGSIGGFIYDQDFDVPVPNATVSIAGSDISVETSDQGNYVLSDLQPGSYTIVIRKEGYSRKVLTDVAVIAGQPTTQDAYLSGEFTEMDEFVVEDIRIGGPTEVGLLELRARSPQFLDSVGSDFLSRAGASDAAQGLRLVSGATTTAGNFAAVRGLPPRYVNTQLNGFSLPSADPDTRAVQLDLFPSEIIESIQVSKTFTPDQQGSASGGAVNIITKSIPEENFISFSSKVEFNTQRPDDGEFLMNSAGPVNYLGIDNRRDLPQEFQGLAGVPPLVDKLTAFGLPGPELGDAPTQYDYRITGGLRGDLGEGLSIGGLVTFFWDQSMSHYENGINDSLVRVNDPAFRGFGLVPDVTGNDDRGFFQDVADGEDQVLTGVFDETQSEHEITWGGLGTFGIEGEGHSFNFTFMHTRVTTSTATIADDTRGKRLKFPGHNPVDGTSPGHVNNTLATDPFGATLEVGGDLREFAPFRRLETQEYVERVVQAIQFNGSHESPFPDEGIGRDGIFKLLAPVVDWNVARSESRREEPATRILDTKFVPPHQVPVDFPVAGLGAYNVYFEDIIEDSTQYRFNVELPFEQWTGDEGSLKLGVFDDRTQRRFERNTFAGGGGAQFIPGVGFVGFFGAPPFNEPFDGQRLSQLFGTPIANPDGGLLPFSGDFRLKGRQAIDAWYWMLDLPLSSFLRVIGGFRYENTLLSTDLEPDLPGTTVFIDGQKVLDTQDGIPPDLKLTGIPADIATAELALGPLDANIRQYDVLPSIGLVLEPIDSVTFRVAYSETIARPTFRELSPTSQALYGGATPFIGNPFLEMSAVENYDFRLDFRPFPDSLVSVSYFKKDIERPIQVGRQAQGQTSFVMPVNFPSGRIEGWEFEVRQNLGRFFDRLEGLTIGGNATLLDTEVKLRDFEADQLAAIDVFTTSVPMTNAPEYLYNLFMTYDSEQTGTQLSVFYTVRGDTLITSPGVDSIAGGNEGRFFIPGVYETEFGTLNLTVSQKVLGDNVSLKFSAKNLTNPKRETVYRSDFIPGGDVVKTSHTDGIDLSVGISANFEF